MKNAGSDVAQKIETKAGKWAPYDLYVQVYKDGPLFAERSSQLSARSLIAHHYGSNSRPHLRAARKTGNTPDADVLLRRLD